MLFWGTLSQNSGAGATRAVPVLGLVRQKLVG